MDILRGIDPELQMIWALGLFWLGLVSMLFLFTRKRRDRENDNYADMFQPPRSTNGVPDA
jgi:hypothetical protein